MELNILKKWKWELKIIRSLIAHVFHISVSISRSWRHGRTLHFFAILLHAPGSHQPASSLLISTQVAIPTANWDNLSVCHFPQRHWGSGSCPLYNQLLQRGWVLHGILHLAGPIRASPQSRDRQVSRQTGMWD